MLTAVTLLLASCEPEPLRPAPRPAVQQGHLTVEGRVRTYRLFTPRTRSEARAALVVVLHDAGNTAEGIAEVTQFDREAERGRFIVAYPEGIEGVWNARFCCGPAPFLGTDDLAFLRRLLDRLEAGGVDPARVYVAGVSNGAIMAYLVACELADRIAGVASVAGTMVLEGCRPARPVSVLEIHGTADPVVPYEGGRLPPFTQATRPVPPAPALAERWASLNSCSQQPAVERSGRVTVATWQPCRSRARVRLVTVRGGGHTWFAREFGPVDGAVDATRLIVQFFGLGA